MEFQKTCGLNIKKAKTFAYQYKLSSVQQEAKSLYEFCLRKQFTNEQIRMCLEPIVGSRLPILTRLISGSTRSLTWIGFFVLFVSMIINWQAALWFSVAQLRLAQLKILPFWDWSVIYDMDCIIDNPFLVSKNISHFDCRGCLYFQNNITVGKMDFLSNVNTSLLTNEYLTFGRPVVITDPTHDWPMEGEFLKLSLDSMKELYLTHDSLTEGSGMVSCEFHSTMEEVRTVHEFVKRLNDKTLPKKYHVAWDNCKVPAAKLFRRYTKRPYFLPPMAEVSRSNQFVVSFGNFSGHYFRLPQQSDSASWMVLLSGELKIKLTPDLKCFDFGCTEVLYFSLRQGQSAIVPTRIWSNMEYSPVSSGSTFAFASSVIWDDVV